MIFTVVFQKIAKLPSNEIPYPLLVLVGLLPWQFFSNSMTESANSLLSNTNLITKVYFPRVIVPCSTVFVSLVDFAISFFLMLCLCVFYRHTPGWELAALPLFIFVSIVFSLAAGIFLSALIIKYRDVKHIIPFVAQLGIYISPVGYSSTLIEKEYRIWFYINPLTGIIDGFRWCLFGKQYDVIWQGIIMSCCIALASFVFAVKYFSRSERTFADII